MQRYRVANMECGGCAKGVAAALREVDPSLVPEFDVPAREMRLAAALPPASILAALTAAGWQVEALGST